MHVFVLYAYDSDIKNNTGVKARQHLHNPSGILNPNIARRKEKNIYRLEQKWEVSIGAEKF